MRVVVAMLLVLSGCTVAVTDTRLTREEVGAEFLKVAAEFKARDEAFIQLAKTVNELKGAKK